MAENSTIEWTDHSFAPWFGCTPVSDACANCYAENMTATRFGKVIWGAGEDRARSAASTWKQPLAWNRKAEREGTRPFVFCSHLSDVFDNEVDERWRHDLWRLIEATPNLVWLLLTKRIGNVLKMTDVNHGTSNHLDMRNVAIGATMADQLEYDRGRMKLAEVKARGEPLFTFGSLEPLLGPVILDKNAPDWIIVGGESGRNARPMHPDWARSLRDQCQAAGVPFFFKQWGEWREAEADDVFDTARGRAGRPPAFIVDPVGHVHCFMPEHADPRCRAMIRVGKKDAGRLLDGVEHNGFPVVAGRR